MIVCEYCRQIIFKIWHTSPCEKRVMEIRGNPPCEYPSTCVGRYLEAEYQPERSKREDLNCDNCKNRPVFTCCWHFGRHKNRENDESCDEYKFRMRCSEHCRNAVRDK